MEHRRLGTSGLKVSSLCMGAMTFGESQGFMKGVTSANDEAKRVLDTALDAGIDFIDTANVYSDGQSEALLGQWLGPRRRTLIIATKCRFAMGPTPHELGLSRRHIIQACEDSLRRLNTEWIDLYQVHMQDGSVGVEETLRALDDLIRAGKVRYAGCSNYTGYRLAESALTAQLKNVTRYESIQLQWSLLERGAEREMIPAAKAFGLGLLVWSPLGRGLLTGKYRKDAPPPAGTRLSEWKDTWKKYNVDGTWKTIETVAAVAAEVGSTPARVALAWLLRKPEVTSVILGARTVAQLQDNLAAQQLALTDAQVKTLDAASEPAWGYPYDFIGGRERW
ncbi:MAG: aldo/keto reductase [Archangium sp.]|nr:aldo/keto reductase [Archangium sp.]